MKKLDISDPLVLQAVAVNMKREATLEAKGDSVKIELDSLMNNCQLFSHEKIIYSLFLSINATSPKERYWHLSIGSIVETVPKPIPPDNLCFYIVSNFLGTEAIEGRIDPRRPNVRHFLKKIV